MNIEIVGRAGGRIAVALLLVMALSLTAAAKPASPPHISDLDGTTWAVKVSGTGYYLDSGGTEKLKGTVIMTFTRVDPDILFIQSDESAFDDVYAYYSDGLLIVGALNDDTLATMAVSGFAVISGTPGKMKIKGQFGTYDTLSDDEASIAKVSGKQMQDL